MASCGLSPCYISAPGPLRVPKRRGELRGVMRSFSDLENCYFRICIFLLIFTKNINKPNMKIKIISTLGGGKKARDAGNTDPLEGRDHPSVFAVRDTAWGRPHLPSLPSTGTEGSQQGLLQHHRNPPKHPHAKQWEVLKGAGKLRNVACDLAGTMGGGLRVVSGHRTVSCPPPGR